MCWVVFSGVEEAIVGALYVSGFDITQVNENLDDYFKDDAVWIQLRVEGAFIYVFLPRHGFMRHHGQIRQDMCKTMFLGSVIGGLGYYS